MDHDPKQERINALFQLIASIDNVDDCRALFEDMAERSMKIILWRTMP